MTQRESRFFGALLALIVLGLLAACSVLWERHQMERSNSTAVLLSDYRSLGDFARNQGLELDAVLRRVKELGVTALAVDEFTRDDLQNNGLARCVNSYELADLQYQGRVNNDFIPQADCVYFVASTDGVARGIVEHACEALGVKRARIVDNEHHVVAINADMRQIGVMGFGISTDVIDKLVGDYGFRVWVRPWNSPFFQTSNVQHILAKLERSGVDGVIFGGLRNEVLGYPHDLESVGELLQEYHLKLGVIELPQQAQQKGIQTLARMCPQNVVRVMSVSPAHQSKMHPQAVASMYGLGARERNIRLLYVRPYFDGFDKLTAVESSELLITTIVSDLGKKLGVKASLFPAQLDSSSGLGMSNFCLLLIAMAVAGALCWNIRNFAVLPLRAYMVIVVFAGAVALLAVITGWGLGYVRLLVALGALIIFPIWGMMSLFPVLERQSENKTLSQDLLAGWKVLGISSCFSLVGGLLGAACLPQLVYMLSIDVFRGVKLHSLSVPLLVMLGWLVYQNRRGALGRLREILNSQVKVWHVIVFAVLLGLGAFYLVRTGNAGGDLVVSDGERELRRWLDMVLGVRPRFKEFLLGNPLLICLPTLIMCRWRGLVPFAVLGAALGEASLAGTYAHLHTPIAVSLCRTVLGIVVGGCLGMVLSSLIYLVHRWWSRAYQQLRET